MAREQWIESATSILGTPVADAVPVARRRANAWLFDVVAAALVTAAILLDFLVLPGNYLFPVVILALIYLSVLQRESRFAALTEDGSLWMLSATRWFPRPMASIRELDPLQVSGPTGLFGQTYVITGAKHSVGLPHKRAFQRMVERARQPASG